jgi:alkylated DNA repair dioxygenase AlkB
LPEPLAALAVRLSDQGLLEAVPDQAIVNEYLPGQGIAPHVDCEPCFGPEIATVSLGCDVPMEFRSLHTGDAVAVWLPVGSVCVLAGESRAGWTHGIAKRRSDLVAGGRRRRIRRVSATFRTVLA